MKLVHVNKSLLQKIYSTNKTKIHLKLVPSEDKSCIKAYTKDGEYLGNVEKQCLLTYLDKTDVDMFILLQNHSSNNSDNLKLVVTTLII